LSTISIKFDHILLKVMPSNAHSTGANTTPLGRVNPALTGGRRQATSSLLNPNYLNSDDEGSHGSYEQKYEPKYETKYESKFDQPSTTPSYSYPTSSSSTSASANTWKRGLEDSNNSDDNSLGGEKKKKRRSRWGGDEKEKTFIPGMPTVLPANLTKDQEEAYLGNSSVHLCNLIFEYCAFSSLAYRSAYSELYECIN
jgi:splicing factor 1